MVTQQGHAGLEKEKGESPVRINISCFLSFLSQAIFVKQPDIKFDI